jgi:hypothetical protein
LRETLECTPWVRRLDLGDMLLRMHHVTDDEASVFDGVQARVG